MSDHHDLRTQASTSGFDLAPVLDYINATGAGDWRTPHRRAGVTYIHQWLSDYPGGTWQQRWVAADADNTFDAHVARNQRDGQRTKRSIQDGRDLRHGMSLLVWLGLIRPSIEFTLRRVNKHAFDLILKEHQTLITSIVNEHIAAGRATTEVAWIAEHAIAAMMAITGKPLAEITVEDWMTAATTRSELLQPYRRWQKRVKDARAAGQPRPASPRIRYTDARLLSLRWAYSACVRAGMVAPHPHPPVGAAAVPPTLDMALAKPRTNESLLDRYPKTITGRLYDLALAVLAEGYDGRDFNTRLNVVSHLNTFISAVQSVLPGHTSLKVDRRHASAIVDRIQQRDTTSDSVTQERESAPMILMSVRRFYDIAGLITCGEHEEFETYEQYQDIVGHFPIPAQTVSDLAARYRKRQTSRLHSRIRRRITTIDELVPAVARVADEQTRFLNFARATPIGETFEHRTKTWLRVAIQTHHASRANIVAVRDTSKRVHTSDALLLAHRAIRAKAVVAVLRHTGVRREEAIEIALDDFGFARIGGANVPSVQIGPAKTDTARTIALHAEAIEACLELIGSLKEQFGEVPIAHRRDEYERRMMTSRRYLFQSYHHGTFGTPDLQTFGNYVMWAINTYNKLAIENDETELLSLSPHDFRRMFATDLLDKDVPVESVRQLMGHVNVATTAIYDHTTWDRAAAKFLEAHRHTANGRAGIACPHCNGTGLIHVAVDHPE